MSILSSCGSRADSPSFEQDLLALVPQMRAFARFLCRDAPSADDLCQEALVKALKNRASYALGTNMKAWVFMILRNHFYSQKRSAWRSLPLEPRLAAETLVARDNPEAILALDEVRDALKMVPVLQREALVMVTAGGLSYEEAASLTGVAVGTVKSRVSRGRERLRQVLEGPFERSRAPAHTALGEILAEISH